GICALARASLAPAQAGQRPAGLAMGFCAVSLAEQLVRLPCPLRWRKPRMNASNTREGQPLPKGDHNQNPPGIGLFALLREDLHTHEGNFFEQGFWAVAVHRFGNWRMGLPKLFRVPCTIFYRFFYKCVEWTCGITLPYTVKLGRRVRIWHHSGMILHARSIGD